MTAAVPVTESGADLSRVHLVGVGGAGMSAIATLLLDRGIEVSGSDAKDSRLLTALAARGAVVAVGQRTENLDLLGGGPTAVVASTAIRADNPELVEAHRRGLPVVRRADALAALMTGHRSVCIAGTHGKTSTTSMLTVALLQAGVDPSFAIGGQLSESGAGAHAGTGDVFVAEADESDGSFLAFRPDGAVVTTVEPDHLDHHGTAAAYAAVFDAFVARIRAGGFLVAGVDDPGVRDLLARVRAAGTADGLRIIRYGRASGEQSVSEVHGASGASGEHGAPGEHEAERAHGVPVTAGAQEDPDLAILDVAVAGTGSRSTVRLPDGRQRVLTLSVPGAHMAANAAGALAAGLALGVDADAMIAGLAGFGGVRRRFEPVATVAGVRVFDDYAHHPTEIAATLAAARGIAGTGRVVAVFQPHLYSRTVQFAEAFGAALSAADVVVVLDVFGAREEPVAGVTGRLVADAVVASRVVYEPSLAAAPDVVANLVRPADVLLTMGAGDVTMLGPRLVALLRRRQEER